MKNITKQNITIYFDDREKHPWTNINFKDSIMDKHFKMRFVRKRLKTGDYTIEGHENLFRIERKNSWNEIISNVSKSSSRELFLKSLVRLSEFPCRYFIVEDDLSRIMFSGQYSKTFNPQTLFRLIVDIQVIYGIQFFSITKYGDVRKHIISNIFYEYLTHWKTNNIFFNVSNSNAQLEMVKHRINILQQNKKGKIKL